MHAYIFSMETLTSRSKIRPCAQTFAVDVSETHLSFSKHYETFIRPITPVVPNQNNYTFVIPPSVSAEMHLPSAEILVSLQVMQEDGTAVSTTDQVGIINVSIL